MTEGEGRGTARAAAWGLGLIIAFAVLGAIAVAGLTRRTGTVRGDARAVVALVTVQEDGSRAADVVAYVRLRPREGLTDIVLVPATTRVAVPGISDDRLRDVYAYGGAKLVGEVFAERFGVPVDVTAVVREDALIDLLGGVGSFQITLDREIDMFRKDRYRTFPEGRPVSVDATTAADLLAASALAEPPGPDMELQARLVSAALVAVAPKEGSIRLGDGWELCCSKEVEEQLSAAASGSAWPSASVAASPGRTSGEGSKAYFEPEATFWKTLGR